MNLSSRRRSIFTLVAAVGALTLGGAIYSRLRAQESRETTEIAPGITLLAVSTQTPSGPLRYWLVKADKSAAKLALEVADARDVNKKRSVRDLAAQSSAIVAVNGGFFAYDGAAVGAVKINGEWHRLPWKSRTALGWNDKEAEIGALSGLCRLVFGFNGVNMDGVSTAQAALNGFALPGTHTAFSNGFTVLTPRFALQYLVAPSESALMVRQNRVTARTLQGKIAIPNDGFLVVARGNSRARLDALEMGAPLSFSVTTAPLHFNDFPQILGAGPLLIQNGTVKTTEVAEEFRPDVIARGPRTAVGLDSDGNWLFLVADGRQAASVGLTIPETAQLFQQLGAVQAMNLDGGSSTQLVVKGELINAPSGYDPVNPLRPREVRVSNALVLKNR